MRKPTGPARTDGWWAGMGIGIRNERHPEEIADGDDGVPVPSLCYWTRGREEEGWC